MTIAWKAWGQRARSVFDHALTVQDCARLIALTESLADAKRVHLRVLEQQHDNCDALLSNLLIGMYARFGSVEDARWVFDCMRERDLISWNFMFSAYAKNGCLLQACSLLKEMPEWDLVSLNAMLKLLLYEGERGSAEVFLESMPCRDLFSWNALLAAYAKKSRLSDARRVFEGMPERDILSWNVILSVLLQEGGFSKLKSTFDCLPETNLVSWNVMLSAYVQKAMVAEAKILFDEMPCRDLVSFTTLLSCFARAGCVPEAKAIFDEMPFHDLVAWNILLRINSSCLEESKRVFYAMPERDEVSWTTLLAGCIGNGEFGAARGVFERLPIEDVASVTAVVVMHAQAGNLDACFELFSLMQVTGLKPDRICFTCLLLACIHSGDSEFARRIFQAQEEDDPPSKQQFACIVDLLGRAGHLRGAQELIASMPYDPNQYEWMSLLSSCRSFDLVVNEFSHAILLPYDKQYKINEIEVK